MASQKNTPVSRGQGLRNKFGPPVSGDEFWNRKHELKSLVSMIEGGHSVLISAPRRVGKTSLMNEAKRILEARGDFTCLSVDVQHARSVEDVVVELAAAAHPHANLWENAKALFGQALDNVESLNVKVIEVKLRGALQGDWQARA